MEEDCGGDLSEDEQPSTDASEDSVDVHVKPIASFPFNLSRLPRKFRKGFETKTTVPLEVSFPTVKLERASPVTLNEAIERSPSLTNCPQRSSSPIHFKTSTIITTGRASPPIPHSPSCVPPKARGNKRKLLEPRRVVEQTCAPEEEWETRRKAQRIERVLESPSSSSAQCLLRHNPFINPLVPHQLLVSPTVWNPVAQYPYSHLVSLAPQLGFLPSAPYPLLPLLPPRMPMVQTVPSKPTLCDTKRKPERNPKDLASTSSSKVNGISESLLKISPEETAPSSLAEELIVQHHHQKPFIPIDASLLKSTSKSKNFLSVESLISSSSRPTSNINVVNGQLLDLHDDENQDLISATEGTIQSLLQDQPKQKQRNYKNMTRERRIEANARERTRVHTISAAFETLRQAVPSFSHNQKLSKLSVLRIASTYILSLSRLAGHDYSQGENGPTFEECVDLTTKTIQIEGKAKKKREE